jgi:hypothetical protein
MNSLQEILKSKKIEKKRGPNCKRNYWIDETAKLLNRPFKQICGLTSVWPDSWIQDMVLYCKDKPALWWHLYKKSKVDN